MMSCLGLSTTPIIMPITCLGEFIGSGLIGWEPAQVSKSEAVFFETPHTLGIFSDTRKGAMGQA